MRVLGFDLGLSAQAALSPSRGTYWFVNFIANRKQTNPKRYPTNQQYDYRDPGLVLKDYAHEVDSPYREVFGYTDDMVLAAKKIVWTRNTWFHFGEDPTLEDLIEVAQHVRAFAQAAGLASLNQVVALLTRLQRIKTGQHQPKLQPSSPGSAPQPSPEPVKDADLPPEEPPAEIPVPDDAPRPRIGGVWVGAIPDTRFKVTRTGDIVDPATFESLKSKVGDAFGRKAKQWLAVPPRGGEVWVAPDGAVGGWINENPRLLGYLGDDPEDEQARGFLLPRFYEVQGDMVRDLDTGECRPLQGTQVDDGTLVRVTTYGDVIVIDDVQGVKRLATVAAADWFPGHLS
ncbi:hypothetical protein [Lysobacter korlensis]